MVVWFVVLGVLGIVNIVHAPQILHALNPLEAVRFVLADGVVAFAVMGGVFLALTGGEALYADMGHVGPKAIRCAWFGLVLPALCSTTLARARCCSPIQGARQPFYKLAPSWALIPMVILAALAPSSPRRR
jgi:KUP system potassium uptake protein